jgi:hypothetical protein
MILLIFNGLETCGRIYAVSRRHNVRQVPLSAIAGKEPLLAPRELLAQSGAGRAACIPGTQDRLESLLYRCYAHRASNER